MSVSGEYCSTKTKIVKPVSQTFFESLVDGGVSPRPVRHAYGARGIALGQHSIILCSFAYKFISNPHYSNGIVSSSPPLYKSRLYRMRTLLQSVLPFLPYYPTTSL
jgi:hypothetical protein